VVDIGLASQALREVLTELNCRNLDEEPAFKEVNTSTEFLSRVVFDRIVARIRAGGLGPGPDGLTAMRVTLHESHIAAASYESDLPDCR